MNERSENGSMDEHDPGAFAAMKLTRRRLLEGGAQIAATAFASSFLPPNLQRALASGAPPASLKQIKHVVLMMQENRSFDHYFGTMAGVRGFNDPHALKLSRTKSVFHQPDPQSPGGVILPFHLDTQKSRAQQIPATDNGWDAQHASWNGGKMNNWLGAHRPIDKGDAPFVMGYYKRDDIPFQFALAEAFTVCDGYFSSVLGPTWPNRMYWMTGTLDADAKHGGPLLDNTPPKKKFRWTTYAERLTKAGVSWKLYHQTDSFGTNIFWQFDAFLRAPQKSELFRNGMTTGHADQFERDVKHDKLPTVSWLLPTGAECEHPDHWPAAGAAFVARKVEALAANPDVWAKTALILSYDENDGMFDHVVPPTAPPHTPGEYVYNLPVGAGFRVPCIIVSPWTVGGWVCSERFDHTSVLRFLEKVTGVREPNITAWRRKTFGDLTSAFRFNHEPGAAPNLPNAHAFLMKVKHDFKDLPEVSPAKSRHGIPAQEKRRADVAPA